MLELRPHLLYVDDDQRQLTAFKAAFRREYEVATAQSATEGLAVLRSQPVDIILTDQRMPERSGIDFLQSIATEFPDLIKILVTGYTDFQDAIDAINKGKVYCFLTKPWDEQELKVIIKNAYEICLTRKLLKDKNELLEKTNRELERFVYSASHDLRSPLMSIKGIINYAKMQGDFAGQGYLPMIEESIDRLDVFVGNIAHYYQNAKHEIESENLELEKLIPEIWDSFNYLKEKEKIQFTCQIDQKAPFKSDNFRVRVILNNLIHNAIKYQKKSEANPYVSVHVKVNPELATFSVKDGGIGIDPEHLEKIFNMFYRATAQQSGSGLGLYIAKEALEKIGGGIEVDSVPGKGTTFHFKIPNES